MPSNNINPSISFMPMIVGTEDADFAKMSGLADRNGLLIESLSIDGTN